MKGLYGYEIFYLYYYGVNVFLCVGDIEEPYVYVYEVETFFHNDLGVETLEWDTTNRVFKGKGSFDCYIIPDGADNSYSGKALKLKPVVIDKELLLPVTVRVDSKLYAAASKINNRSLPVGVYYAKKICDGSNKQIDELLETGFETKVIPWESYKGIPQA